MQSSPVRLIKRGCFAWAMKKRGDASTIHILAGLVVFAIVAIGLFLFLNRQLAFLEKPQGSEEEQAARSNLARLAEAINRLTEIPDTFAAKDVEFSLHPGFVIVGFDGNPVTDLCCVVHCIPPVPVQKPKRSECSGSCLCLYSGVSAADSWPSATLIACEPLQDADKVFTVFNQYLFFSRNYWSDYSLRVYYQNMVGGDKDFSALDYEHYQEFPFSRDVFRREQQTNPFYTRISTLFTDLVLYGQCEGGGWATPVAFSQPRILSIDKSRVDGKDFILLGGRTSDMVYRRNALLRESNLPLPAEPPPTVSAGKQEPPPRATQPSDLVYRDDILFYRDNLGLRYAVIREKVYQYIGNDAGGPRWTVSEYTLDTLPGPKRAAPQEIDESMWRLLEDVEPFLVQSARPPPQPPQP